MPLSVLFKMTLLLIMKWLLISFLFIGACKGEYDFKIPPDWIDPWDIGTEQTNIPVSLLIGVLLGVGFLGVAVVCIYRRTRRRTQQPLTPPPYEEASPGHLRRTLSPPSSQGSRSQSGNDPNWEAMDHMGDGIRRRNGYPESPPPYSDNPATSTMGSNTGETGRRRSSGSMDQLLENVRDEERECKSDIKKSRKQRKETSEPKQEKPTGSKKKKMTDALDSHGACAFPDEKTDANGNNSDETDGREELSIPEPCQHEKSNQHQSDPIDDQVIASKSVSLEVNQNGDEIMLGGCIVTFPEGAFDKVTKVRIKLEMDSSKWPESYLGISPIVYMTSDNPLQKPLSILLYSWCMSDNSEESKGTKVEVLHLQNGDSQWNTVATLPFSDTTTFPYEFSDFSAVFAAIRKPGFDRHYFLVEGYLFANEKNEFTLVFCLKSSLLFDEIVRRMHVTKSSLKLSYNIIDSHYNDTIVATVRTPEDFPMNPRGTFAFQITESLIQIQKFIKFNFTIEHEGPEMRKRIKLECDLKKNDEYIDRNQCFNYDWHYPK